MVQVIVSLSEEKEKELRKLAMDKYDGKKGSLSKIVEEGIEMVKNKKEQEKNDKDFWELVNNAKDLGKINFTREEANE